MTFVIHQQQLVQTGKLQHKIARTFGWPNVRKRWLQASWESVVVKEVPLLEKNIKIRKRGNKTTHSKPHENKQNDLPPPHLQQDTSLCTPTNIIICYTNRGSTLKQAIRLAGFFVALSSIRPRRRGMCVTGALQSFI